MSSVNDKDTLISLPVAQPASSGCGCGTTETKQKVDARKGAAWWRSLGEREQDAQAMAFAHREFSAAADTLDGEDRRTFIKIMGAGFAMAGLGLAGCRRWPESQIVPNASQPANRIPGVPVAYATATEVCGVGYGLIATSYDGRPIKLDGNADHPFWGGTSTAWMQARVLELYDPQRSRQVFQSGKPSDYAAFEKWIGERTKLLQSKQGEGLAILTQANSGASMADMLARVKQAFPQSTVTTWEPLAQDAEMDGFKIAFGGGYSAISQLDKATVIVALDSDLLGSNPLMLASTRQWAAGRRLSAADPTKQTQNRMYAIEPGLTITGMAADNRLAVRRGDIPVFTAMLAQAIGVDASIQSSVDRLAASACAKTLLDAHAREVFDQMVKDLQAAKGSAVVLCGEGQPAEMHALVAAINIALGAMNANTGTLRLSPTNAFSNVTQLGALVHSMNAGSVDTLIVLGANPCYDAPAEMQWSKAMAKVPHIARLAYYRDETSMDAACTFHLPATHFLEC